MDEDERKRLEARVRELEEYLEGFSGGDRVGRTGPDGQRMDATEEEIAKTRREIDELKKLLG